MCFYRPSWEHQRGLLLPRCRNVHASSCKTLTVVLPVAEQPLLKFGLRVEHVGGGVQSDDGGLSVTLKIVSPLKVPSARKTRDEIFACMKRHASHVPCKVNLNLRPQNPES